MVPLVSEALAVMLKLEPAVMVLPSDGLVMETAGGADGAAATVMDTALDVVETPLASVALAVRV